MPEERKPSGLNFGEAVAAADLPQGQIVVVDGQVVESGPDPDDPTRVRVVIVRLLAGLEVHPDQREVIVSIPRDMKIATAHPINTDLPSPPFRS